MKKSHNKTIGVIAVFLMLGASPLSVTYSFADIQDNQKERIGVILTEEVVNGKLQVRHYTLPLMAVVMESLYLRSLAKPTYLTMQY